MANKDVIKRPKYIFAGDASGNITGDWLYIADLDNVGFQAKWTGAPVGTFLFEVSNDAPANSLLTANKATMQPDGRLGPTALTLPPAMLVGAAIPSGTGGNFYFGFNQLEAIWIRMSFVFTSGTGTLNVGASAKSV